jgi:hypothetical protein
MLQYVSSLPVAVTVAIRPRIVRRGPPAVGALFFDKEDRLIYVIANTAVRYYKWHRVYIDGRLSQIVYEGWWDPEWEKRGTHAKARR